MIETATLHTTLVVLSLTGAVCYGVTTRGPPTVLRMVTKTSAIGLLAILNFLLDAPTLLIAAQATSACGDAFLAWDGEGPFLCGLGSFLVAHIFYIRLFSQSGGGLDVIMSDYWRIAVAGVLLLASLGMISRLLPAVKRDLQVPIIVYSTALYTMVVTALTMDKGRLIFGAIVFLTSDTLLAIGEFLVASTSPHQPWIQDSVWVLYYTGQLLIMLDVTPLP